MNRLVVPFHYYGIRDELIEYGIKETKGHKFVEQFSNEKHCEFISRMIEEHRIPGQKLKALAFCRDISHAIRMSQAMEDYYHTRYLTGKNSVGERLRAYKDLQDESAEPEILFAVDILNEGVDIPGVNMVDTATPLSSVRQGLPDERNRQRPIGVHSPHWALCQATYVVIHNDPLFERLVHPLAQSQGVNGDTSF